MDFPEYITKYGTTLPDAVAGTPVEIVTGFKTFIKFQNDQAAKNGTPPPTPTQLIAVWKANHSTDNKSITYLTIGQLRQMIRDEVRMGK